MAADAPRAGRRKALGLLAAAPLAAGSLPARAEAPKRVETPVIEMGPFYPVRKPADRDADLTLVRGRRQRAAGELVEISGQVVTVDGKPVPHALLELWQANHHGRYAHPADANPAPLDPNFQGYALVRADAQGRYRLRTIKPGSYPAEEGWTRPPHIHVDVRGQDYRAVLQMFFPGEALNDKDRILQAVPAEQRGAAVARETGKANGVTQLAWDIVLYYG